MADETTPEPTPIPEPVVPAPAEPVVTSPVAPPAPAAKRKIWPFILAGGIVLFLLVVTGIIFAVLAILGALGGSPKDTVLNYDKAYETADCKLYQSTLTQAYKDDVLGGKDFDCKSWAENAKTFTVDGEYVFQVDIVISKVDGDEAQFVTHETDSSEGDPYEYTVRYYLEKDNGKWLIDDIVDETPQ